MKNHPNDSKKRLQVRIMYTQAKSRYDDAEVLESRTSTRSDSGYLLRLLAFELSLKCLLVIHDKKISPSHNYCKLIRKLPSEVFDNILKVAGDRMTTHADYSNPIILLTKFSENFIALRYPYDRYQNMTEEEYIQYGKLWFEIGSPIEEAEFIYYSLELDGLIYALFKEVEKWLNENPEDRELKPSDEKEI